MQAPVEEKLRSVEGESWLAQGQTNLVRACELQVAGLHNAANALAALALCRAVRLSYPPLLKALREFRGLPHRVQRVAEIGGVTFYDDSKGTNVGATVAALEGLARPCVLILGGDGKGQDFSPLRDAARKCSRAAVLVGRDRERIARALSLVLRYGWDPEPESDSADGVLPYRRESVVAAERNRHMVDYVCAQLADMRAKGLTSAGDTEAARERSAQPSRPAGRVVRARSPG